ncbi:hypothetical protein C8A00DRAFT_47244 [Chaetomidium leptoderma]|uniref:N-acetyltransferase domain-containing protein n=1 Tax=Chaetomidium leptoderma TaxID=669021 RepID=A0AAN6VCW0_9PEZI|nr:hypothetical protein C8A00DRAFT_47244 [Chaetomidium leptoderma]
MMRRSHRKSRNGCLECKKRHTSRCLGKQLTLQCDETRPSCINCATVQRNCQFSTPRPAAEWPPSDRSASPQIPSAGPSTGPASTPAPPSAAFPGLQLFTSVKEPHSRVNMVHMELLHHSITDTALYPVPDSGMKSIILTTALREPYVMHSTLALSAHHLSVIRPNQQAYYYNLAMQLQTHALSLFNSIDVALLGDSVEKRVPVFIFSCVLGFHALCDTLSHRDPDFDSALSRFVAYIGLHRGLLTVMNGYWDELRKTELQVIFDDMVPAWFQVKSEGRECDGLRERLASAGLDAEELEATQHTLDVVQWVFDSRPGPEGRAYVLCSWAPMLRSPFVRMLEAGRPEALAVLAYYFLVMHHCREVWMIGGAGQHFLTLLANHFRGGDWYAWPPGTQLPPHQHIERIVQDPIPMARDFVVTRPQEPDAPRIAEIHLAAMDANPLLHAQFPAPESLKALEQFLEAYTVQQLRDSGSGVLVARDVDTGVVVGFAKWDSPTHPENVKLESGDMRYLEGCQRAFLDGYASLAEEAKRRCFPDQACYRLSFVCTDPAYQGLGAGSLLTRKVLEMAAVDGLPVYLESTEVAVPMYEKLGFKVIDGFEMKITRPGSTDSEDIYKESCMAWHPLSKQGGS